jgi:TonB family protein
MSSRVHEHLAPAGPDIPSFAKAIFDIRLAEDGSITQLTLKRSSGHEDWDASAMAAVRQASPFPPPPGGQRHFIVEVSPPRYHPPVIPSLGRGF